MKYQMVMPYSDSAQLSGLRQGKWDPGGPGWEGLRGGPRSERRRYLPSSPVLSEIQCPDVARREKPPAQGS